MAGSGGRNAFILLTVIVVGVAIGIEEVGVSAKPSNGPHFDTSIHEFNNERTCWTGEVCKTEFQSEFRCKCPKWHWCRGPGRYYHAFCSISALGHIWLQPGGLREEDALYD